MCESVLLQYSRTTSSHFYDSEFVVSFPLKVVVAALEQCQELRIAGVDRGCGVHVHRVSLSLSPHLCSSAWGAMAAFSFDSYAFQEGLLFQ